MPTNSNGDIHAPRTIRKTYGGREMTEGIRKERLIEIAKSTINKNNEELQFILRWLITTECTELDPWLPIDENTPRDEELLLSFRINEGLRKIRIGFYNDSFGMPELATHYKLLK